MLDRLDDDDAEHFAELRRLLDQSGVEYELDGDPRARARLLHADRVRVRVRAPRRAGGDARRAAVATTAWSRRSAARRRPAAAGPPGSSGSCWRSTSPSPCPRRDVFVAAAAGAERPGVRARAGAARRRAAGRARPRRALAEGPDEACRPARRGRAVIIDDDGRAQVRDMASGEQRELELATALEVLSTMTCAASAGFPPLRANEYRDTWCGQVLGDRVDSEAAARRLGPPPPRPRRPGVHRPARPHRARPARLPSRRLGRGVRALAPAARPRTCSRSPGTIVRRDPRDGQPRAADRRVRAAASPTPTLIAHAQTPPFEIESFSGEVGEEMRLRYRYLDLRRERMARGDRHAATRVSRRDPRASSTARASSTSRRRCSRARRRRAPATSSSRRAASRARSTRCRSRRSSSSSC